MAGTSPAMTKDRFSCWRPPITFSTTPPGSPPAIPAGGHASEDYWAFVGPFGGATAATILRALIDHPRTIRRSAVADGQFLCPDRARRIRSRPPSGQGQPLDAALAGRDDARRRRHRDAGHRGVCRAPPVVVASADPVSASHAVRADAALCQGRRCPGSSNMIFVSSRASRNRLPRRRLRPPALFQSLDRRSRSAKDRCAVADVDLGCVFRPRLSCPARTGAVRHGIADHLFSCRRAGSRGRGYQPGSRGRRRQYFHKSYGDQTGEFWSPNGRLLATTTQIAYFKA